MNEFITEDRRCGKCGTPIQSWESEPEDIVGDRNGAAVVMSVWTTLQPCGHAFKQATGASLD